MVARSLSRQTLAAMASDAGLSLLGVTDSSPFLQTADYVENHIRSGHTTGMDWFTVQRAHQSADPATLQTSVLSIVSVGLPFWSGPVDKPDDGVLRGRIARYAWGRDYHRVMKRRMKTFGELLSEHTGVENEYRFLVDTARVFDRAVAARSGLGWFGKNSMIIVPGHGSWVMLGELYLDLHIPSDLPLSNNCGRCSICIDKCPTQAIIEPYRVHAPRCISYLTIEERGILPVELRSKMSDWVFGCDICQNVCPYTAAAKRFRDVEFEPARLDNAFPSLEALVSIDEAEFYDLFRGTAVVRAKRRGMARNAVVALGNSQDLRAVPVVENAASQHDEPLVRGHAVWALGNLLGIDARSSLRTLTTTETDDYVQREIHQAQRSIQG